MGAEGIFSRLKCLQYVALGNESIPHVWALVPNKQFIIGLLQRGFSMISMRAFYRSQNVLGWSKFFVPDQIFIYILWQSQTFCARQRDDSHSVKLVFVPA